MSSSSSEEFQEGKCDGCKRKNLSYLVVCSICSDFHYCLDCAYVCQCGQGDTHYLCPDAPAVHTCNGTEDIECGVLLCLNAEIPGYERCCNNHSLWCKDHTPPVSKQMKQLVLDALSYEELQEASAQKRIKK